MNEKLKDVLRLIDAAVVVGHEGQRTFCESDYDLNVMDIAADIVCQHVLERELTVDETSEFRCRVRALLALPND